VGDYSVGHEDDRKKSLKIILTINKLFIILKKYIFEKKKKKNIKWKMKEEQK